MRIKAQFYPCNNGVDYVVDLREGSGTITLTNIATNAIQEFRMKDHQDAIAQIKLWNVNAPIRIPRTFAICTDTSKGSLDISRLRESLAKHDLTLPETFLLKKYIIYHGHESMLLDGDFVAQNVPIIDTAFLDKVSRKVAEGNRIRKSAPITGGLFSNAN